MTMNNNVNNKNGSRGLPIQFDEPAESEPLSPQSQWKTVDPTGSEVKEEPVITPPSSFATRASIKGGDGIGKSKLLLLGGGLVIAVLFFVFTALVGKSSKKQGTGRQPPPLAKQSVPLASKGSVTPVMDSVRTSAPDNVSGQLSTADIRRTRSSDGVPSTAASS